MYLIIIDQTLKKNLNNALRPHLLQVQCVPHVYAEAAGLVSRQCDCVIGCNVIACNCGVIT